MDKWQKLNFSSCLMTSEKVLLKGCVVVFMCFFNEG